MGDSFISDETGVSNVPLDPGREILADKAGLGKTQGNETHPLTDVVGADLEGLVPSHDQTGLARLLVLEQADVARAPLLPLKVVLEESEELCAPGVSARSLVMASRGGAEVDRMPR